MDTYERFKTAEINLAGALMDALAMVQPNGRLEITRDWDGACHVDGARSLSQPLADAIRECRDASRALMQEEPHV